MDVNFLHLTDLHFGQKQQPWLWPNVRDLFFRDLETLAEKAGPWDLVLFSGDLAYSGQPTEYDALSRMLDELWEHFARLGSDPVLLAVPGNHDVLWPAKGSSAWLTLKGLWHTDEDLREAFWSDPADERRELVRTSFAPYERWWSTRPLPSSVSWQPGLLPGDFAATFSKGDLRLGIAGLNSTFLQLRSGITEGTLDLDPRQLVPACDGDPPDWVRQHQLCLLMTHQPPSWLCKAGKDRLRSEVAPGGGFALHLYGHMHEPRSGSERLGGGETRRELQGASLFGLERWETPQGTQEQRIHGYSAGRLEVNGTKAALTVWPRVVNRETQDGTPRLVRDQSFALDEDTGAYTDDSLRARAITPAGKFPAGRNTGAEDPFVREYRRRLGGIYERWELANAGVAQAGGVGRPIEVKLDSMYVPLRIAEGYDPNKLDQGEELGPEALLQRKSPLAIRGAAGAGKTTWVRWTFRHLLERPDALPVMVELRRLAACWGQLRKVDPQRSLDTYVEDWVAGYLGESWRGRLLELCRQDRGPRPVLLVDGWDELGALGEELREKLTAFRNAHPRVLVVVTSRPYGDSRPSHSEGFEVLDIQPLSDSEIADLSSRFFSRCYGEDEGAGNEAAQRFQEALGRSPDATALARTPLLLTMMLLISRSSPLPDQRHQLYQACVRNLLSALPDRRQAEGAQLLHEQWRPENSEERLRVAAELAYGVQEEGYRTKSRAAMVRTWKELLGFLPENWDTTQREGFLAWLSGPSGLLVDRTDGTVSFAHLSFQEFLSAWHLEATADGPSQRKQVIEQHVGDGDWWETLRLWSALVASRNPDHLEAVLAALASGTAPRFWLAGAILADGLGTEPGFRAWVDRVGDVLAELADGASDRCASAWRTSRQEDRLSRISSSIGHIARTCNWMQWLRLRQWASQAAAGLELPRPTALGNSACMISLLFDDQPARDREVAVGRVLTGLAPYWLGEDAALIAVWPSHRRLVATRLQAAASLGATRTAITNLARRPLAIVDGPRALARDIALKLARNLPREVARDMAHSVAGDVACFLARFLPRFLAQVVALDQARSLALDQARDVAHYLARDRVRYLTRDVARDPALGLARPRALHQARALARALTLYQARYLARELGASMEAWGYDFGRLELDSSGRVMMRALIAHQDGRGNTPPRVAIVSAACRLSFYPDTDPAPLNALLASYSGDPLWPALARHMARRATPEDRALLEDLVRHPEKRQPSLSWALRYIVRGDVMLDDGSVITIDELSDELGLPRLPYLEDLPDELEVDWDAND